MALKRRRGRPSFKPTKKDRETVYELAAAGLAQEYIRTRIINPETGNPISKPALEKHFRAELNKGMPEFEADAVRWLAIHMRGRPAVYTGKGKSKKLVAKEIEPKLTAAIYVTKARLGWRDGGERGGGGEAGEQKVVIEGGLDDQVANDAPLPSPFEGEKKGGE